MKYNILTILVIFLLVFVSCRVGVKKNTSREPLAKQFELPKAFKYLVFESGRTDLVPLVPDNGNIDAFLVDFQEQELIVLRPPQEEYVPTTYSTDIEFNQEQEYVDFTTVYQYQMPQERIRYRYDIKEKTYTQIPDIVPVETPQEILDLNINAAIRNKTYSKGDSYFAFESSSAGITNYSFPAVNTETPVCPASSGPGPNATDWSCAGRQVLVYDMEDKIFLRASSIHGKAAVCGSSSRPVFNFNMEEPLVAFETTSRVMLGIPADNYYDCLNYRYALHYIAGAIPSHIAVFDIKKRSTEIIEVEGIDNFAGGCKIAVFSTNSKEISFICHKERVYFRPKLLDEKDRIYVHNFQTGKNIDVLAIFGK